MAVLTDQQRAEAMTQMMRDMSNVFEPCGLTKTQLRAAIDATDQWIEDNSTSYNNALPVAARTALTAAQKRRLFLAVAKKRWEV